MCMTSGFIHILLNTLYVAIPVHSMSPYDRRYTDLRDEFGTAYIDDNDTGEGEGEESQIEKKKIAKEIAIEVRESMQQKAH
ncbi:unnamed protein product [Ambrosiozyma monospora]|uniref:Unnamed protein product n=1 Tax=Ambrosiozyma monospora TaxID=43982 RepID=A0ACB5T0T5_AMBMO|nr:unnamed protein product [Ambrosiozyma monospora]